MILPPFVITLAFSGVSALLAWISFLQKKIAPRPAIFPRHRLFYVWIFMYSRRLFAPTAPFLFCSQKGSNWWPAAPFFYLLFCWDEVILW